MTAPRASRSPLAATFAATLAVAGMAFAGAANAADPASSSTVEVARVAVSYGDLDLDTEHGAATLQRRIAAAARQVCGAPNPRELRLYRISQECMSQAIARAVDDVGSPRLAKLHAGRTRALRG